MEFWIRKSNIIEEDEDLSASQDLADFIENERQIKQGMIFIEKTNVANVGEQLDLNVAIFLHLSVQEIPF